MSKWVINILIYIRKNTQSDTKYKIFMYIFYCNWKQNSNNISFNIIECYGINIIKEGTKISYLAPNTKTVILLCKLYIVSY